MFSEFRFRARERANYPRRRDDSCGAATGAKYQIIGGGRRYQALTALGAPTIKAIIRRDYTPEQALVEQPKLARVEAAEAANGGDGIGGE